MADSSLHMVYRAVVVAKLTYAASAWWGFASAADRQRMEAVLRRGKRSGLCSGNFPTIAELVDRADDELFEKVYTVQPTSRSVQLSAEWNSLVLWT